MSRVRVSVMVGIRGNLTPTMTPLNQQIGGVKLTLDVGAYRLTAVFLCQGLR